jgi:hypothetical protein
MADLETGMVVAISDCMKVRIIRKLAEVMDGVDLANYDNGDVIDLPARKARLLVAEGWAAEERRTGETDSRVLAFRRRHDLGHWRDDERDVPLRRRQR